MYKSILVISSDEREKYGIFSRLSSSTTAVYVTSTVQEAMPYLTDQRLCLVILDAEISQKDNHTLLKSIKKLKTTPILVLSSQPGHAQRLETLKAGAHAYMGTPYTMEECFSSPILFRVEPCNAVFSVSNRASQLTLVVKNLPANAGDIKDPGSIPGPRRSLGGGHGNTLQYFCLENSMDTGAWWAIVHKVAKSQTPPRRLSSSL